jgi:excisionase family DNA binding protein
MSTSQLEPLLTRKETAAILRVHCDTVWKWCRRGKLAFVRMGRTLRFRPADITKFLEARTVPASSGAAARVSLRQGAELPTDLARRQISKQIQGRSPARSAPVAIVRGDARSPDAKHPDMVLTDIQKRGKYCFEIKEEVKRIKHLYNNDGRNMSEIREQHPDYQIWQLVQELSVEVRETFERPGLWANPVSYARFLLSERYARSPLTIRDWEKFYRRHKKSLKGPGLK